MKTILVSILAIVAVTTMVAQQPSSTGNGNPFFSSTKTNTADDLRVAVVKYYYNWGSGNESIKLNAGGTGQHVGGTTHFDIRWHVINAQEIEIVRSDGIDPYAKARIKFSADYTSFTGLDFGGGRPVTGAQMVPTAAVQPAAGNPASANGGSLLGTTQNTNDDLRRSITKNSYTWESGDTKKDISFDASGTGQQSDFRFKWRVVNPQQIEIVGVDAVSGKAKAVLNFNSDYSAFTGTDFDGVRAIKGSQSTAKP
jgi:hypothetical protein